MSKTYSAGIVTAYGAAKRAGYQGTYEDFCRQQAGYAESAATVEQAKNTAVSAANTATAKAGEATTAATAAQTAKTQTEAAASQALTDISTARSGAISAVQTEGQTQTANARSQAQAAATSATTASTKASEASASATSAGQSATNAAASATSAAQSASNAQNVLDSIPADYSEMSADVEQLKADLNDKINNLTVNFEENIIPCAKEVKHEYIDANNIFHTSSTYDAYYYDANDIGAFTLIRTGSLTNDIAQIAFFSGATPATNNLISKITFTTPNDYSTLENVNIPSNAKTVIVFNRNATIQASDILIKGVLAQNIVKKIYDVETDIDELQNGLMDISSTKTYTVTDTLDDISYTTGGYINKSGNPQTSSGYKYTNKIACNPGDVFTNDLGTFRFVCAYNGETVISSAGSDSAVSTYTVPDGIDGVIFSVLNSGSQTVKNITRTYQATEYTTNGADEGIIAFSSCGNNAVKTSTPSLSSGVQLSLEDFPYYLKKGESFSFFGKFDSFTSITIGKGYNQYRGTWLEIDDTNIICQYRSNDETTTTIQTVAHEMTFEDFVGIAITIGSDNDAKIKVAINTLAGSKGFTFDLTNKANSHEFNGVAFVTCGQVMSDVVFSATADDAKCPMWLFGDSYFGGVSTRIIGQLINLGYGEGVLIDGRAGNNATHAFSDFTKLLNMGAIPKYLVWCLGMNGTAYDNIEKATALKGLSEKYGFELILYMVPTIPTRKDDNNATNTGYLALNTRYIDAKKAVGATDNGVWYNGYLDTNESKAVHPTALGAQAIAMRICIDVPEIMQYGHAPGTVGGSISGDQ